MAAGLGARNIPVSARPQTCCCVSWSISILTLLALTAPGSHSPAGSGPHGRVWPWQCMQRECEEAEAASTAAPAQDQQKAGKSKNGTHSKFNWNTHFSGTQLELKSSKASPFAPALWNNPRGHAAAAPISAGSRVRFGSICTIMLLIIQTLFCVCRYRSLLARWKILRKKDCN